MGRTPQLSAKDLISFLKRHGFTEVRQEGSHLTLWHEQQRLAVTIPACPSGLRHPVVPGAARWQHRLKLPDAIMAASAVVNDAALVSADTEFDRVTSLSRVALAD